jgi:SanA protein
VKKKYFSLLNISIAITLVMVVLVLACNLWLINRAHNNVFDNIEKIPSNHIGLLMDCNQESEEETSLPPDGRLQAAADLYHAGKIGCVVISTNKQLFNNKPEKMKQALVEKNIPETAIVVDYGESGMENVLPRVCRRFQQTSLTVISNRFHTYRPVFMGNHMGIHVVAYCSQDLPWFYALKKNGRELLERVTSVVSIYVL